MPDRDECISAPIPRIDPTQWEDHEGFRETLLLHVSDPEANETLRRFGRFIFGMSLECVPSWLRRPESETRAEMLAALADLRHLQGFLGAVGREHQISSLSVADHALSLLATQHAAQLARIGDDLERSLGVSG